MLGEVMVSTLQDRAAIWYELDTGWDVVIIGGGITGVAVLREATRAGLRAVLFEADDFASGTSSRSSKLVHGGLRYLRTGNFNLTAESVRERSRLKSTYPNLVTPLANTIICYSTDGQPPWLTGIGLAIYDILGHQWQHSRESPAAVRNRLPIVNPEGLICAYQYGEATTDDARLVLRVLSEAVQTGGTALNYVKVDALLHGTGGRVHGVSVTDTHTGQSKEIRASVVVNATGAWVDDIRASLGRKPRLRLLRGSHLLFPAAKFPLQESISFLHPADKRPVFAYPWQGATIVGTTDVDHDSEMSTEVRCSAEEASYLLDGLQHAFSSASPEPQDALASLAGVRSVVSSGKSDPSKESRDFLMLDEPGLISVTGGKLTTFRPMAIKVVSLLRRKITSNSVTSESAVTHEKIPRIDGAQGPSRWQSDRLWARFGTATPALVQYAHPGDWRTVGGTTVTWAELRWAAHAEGVLHLADLMLRRARLGLVAPHGGTSFLPEIRAIAQVELGWNDERWAREQAGYKQMWTEYYSPVSLTRT